MKTSKLIIATLIFLGISANAQAQFLDKIIKKTERKIESEAENRTQRKINEKIDEVFDEAEGGIEGSDKKRSSNEGSSSVGEVESSYMFEVTATMLLTSFNKKKESYNTIKQSYGNNAMMSEMDDEQKMLFVTDFNNDIAIMINPSGKTATIMSMTTMRKFIEGSAVEPEENNTAKMVKTGATKTINGYKCYQYIITDKNAKIDAWFAPDVDFYFQKHLGGFAKMFGKNKNNTSSLLNKGQGYVMEFSYFEKGVKKSEMKVTNFTKTPRTIRMNDYSIQSMF